MLIKIGKLFLELSWERLSQNNTPEIIKNDKYLTSFPSMICNLERSVIYLLLVFGLNEI